MSALVSFRKASISRWMRAMSVLVARLLLSRLTCSFAKTFGLFLGEPVIRQVF